MPPTAVVPCQGSIGKMVRDIHRRQRESNQRCKCKRGSGEGSGSVHELALERKGKDQSRAARRGEEETSERGRTPARETDSNQHRIRNPIPTVLETLCTTSRSATRTTSGRACRVVSRIGSTG